MPSYARKHQLQASLLYHAFSRINGRRVIFSESDDFGYFKLLLREYGKRFEARIYHWVVMPNHYHLVSEFAQPELISKFMAGVHRSYSYYYHKRYGTVGFLWQGRFKLQPIQKDLYLKSCGRYVERNPVRAGMALNAREYAHSSARFYCEGINDGITHTDPGFEDFGKDLLGRRGAYTEFLKNFDRGEESNFANLESPCGDREFIRRLVREGGQLFPRRQDRKAAIFVV